MSLLQILKDYSPVISPILSPIIAAVTAILLFQRKEQERVHCTINWKYVAGHGGPREQPFLFVHNRSDRSVAIQDLWYTSGALRRSRSESTALGYEDPEDVAFPYIIEPGKIRALQLDERQATKIADAASWLVRLLSRLGRPRVRVQARTTAGKRITVSAEGAIAWQNMPAWLQ